MPAPYLGFISPEMQELSERLMRLQVSQAERAFEQGGVERPAPRGVAPTRTTGPQLAPGEMTQAESLTLALQRQQEERLGEATEMSASIAERSADLAERQQDWRELSFGIEQQTKRIQAQYKAMAPMTVGLEQAVYLPGQRQFDIPKLTFPQVIDPGPESVDIIVVDPNTGQEIGRLNKNLVKKGKVVSDFLDNMWVFDENTGALITRVLNPNAPLKYQLEVKKAKSPVEVALISERARMDETRMRTLADIEVAGITRESALDVARIGAESKLDQILSDERIATWGIVSKEKIEAAKNFVSQGMLKIAEGRLQLDDRAVDLLNLREWEKIKVNKFLALHHDELVEALGEKGIEVQLEGVAVEREKIVVSAYEAETDRLNVEWAHEDREETTDILRFEAESKDRFREAQGAEGIQKNVLYEKSVDNDFKVNMLRTGSLNRLNAATTKATLAGIPRDDRLTTLKEKIAEKDIWYKDQLVRIEDLRVKLDGLHLDWTKAEGEEKLALKDLVDRARANLLRAEADSTRAASELAQDTADYERERNKTLDSKDVAWNAAWEKMLRGESLSDAEQTLIGDVKTPYVAETLDDVLTMYRKKQEVLAEHAPWAPSSWEEQQKVLKYEAGIKATLDEMGSDQKLEFEKKKADIDFEITKKESGLDVKAKKEIIEYEAKFKLGRKDKENLFERYAKAAASIARPGLMGGAFSAEERQYAARVFIGMVQTDKDLTPAEKAHFISWASIIGGRTDVEMSKLISGEEPMVDLPGEGLSFTEFLGILDGAFSGKGKGAPAAPVTSKAPRKVEEVSAKKIMKFVDDYKRKHPKWTAGEVRKAVRKRFGV